MSAADGHKWDTRYRERGPIDAPPSDFLLRMRDRLPRAGRCLDVAGGSGRNALLLARFGLDVTLLDVSAAGLELARSEAARAGLRLRCCLRDLETEGLPPGPYELLVQIHFLRRPLVRTYPDVLVPGGLVLLEHPTRTNLTRHARPPERWVLEDGELPGLIASEAPALEILHAEEGWGPNDRHEARLLARRRE